jgi:hypothetical protein
MSSAVAVMVEFLSARIAAGQTLAGIKAVYQVAGFNAKSAEYPHLLVGESPETERPNEGNARRLVTATLQVICQVNAGKRADDLVAAEARAWRTKLRAALAESPRLVTTTCPTGFALSTRATSGEVYTCVVGESRAGAAEEAVTILYSEYPS